MPSHFDVTKLGKFYMHYQHALKASASNLSDCGHLTPVFENGQVVHSETLETIRARILADKPKKPSCPLPDEWAELTSVTGEDVQSFTQIVQLNKHAEEE